MLNILRFVKNGHTLRQQITLQPEDRLAGLISAPITCDVQLDGSQDAANKPTLVGQVQTSLVTDCQVCMKTLKADYDFEFELYPVNEKQMTDLNDDQEPLLIEDGEMELTDLIINEFILSLPAVLTHEVLSGEDCSKHQVMRAGEAVESKKRSPFEVLKQLKSDDFNS